LDAYGVDPECGTQRQEPQATWHGALLTLVEAGRVDVVMVYKLDRLTRSMVDLGKLMEIFK
jgi:Resolvase, N terminal domain